MPRQIIVTETVGHDSAKAGGNRINAMTAELYDNHIALIDSGTADAKVLAMTVAPGAYYEGMHFTFINLVANTGAATINVNTLGAIALKKNSGADLASGDLVAGGVYEVIKKGANFVVLNLGEGAGGGSAAVPLMAGKIISGYIEVLSVDNPNFTADIKVAPGTKVQMDFHKKGGIIDLVAGTFQLVLANADDWVLYTNFTGNLAVAREVNLPTGDYVTLMRSVTWYGNFNLKPILPTNHYFPLNNEFTYTNTERVSHIEASDFGTVGDDATSNNDAFAKIALVCYFLFQSNQPVRVHLKNGTYRISAGVNFLSNVWLTGQSKSATKIKSITPEAPPTANISDVMSLTFLDVKVGDYSVGTTFEYKDCLFNTTSANAGFYHVYLGANAFDASYKFTDCDFTYGTIYAGLWLHKARSFSIKGCNFTGDAWHNLRVVPSEDFELGIAEVLANKVTGGTTGIFFGSNRVRPIEGIIVENNVCTQQKEESISFDGFGNNAGLCPVIANGTIVSATNDVSGRLKVVVDMVYHDGATANQPCPISLREDWTRFYFSFGEASGREGVVAKIVAFDDPTNTLTLDLYTDAANIDAAGKIGVHAGFFNCKVRNNTIIGSVGAGNAYATALSIYLNVFGMLIENNFISGCAQGINLAGGLMLSTYRTLTYNNIIKNNTFLGCNEVTDPSAAVNFRTYGSDIKMYGNQFVNNTVVGGKLLFERQQNFIYDGNNISQAAITWKHCANALPTADASQIGKRFMLITDDGSGDPTAITYYVCKLAASVYSWVEL